MKKKAAALIALTLCLALVAGCGTQKNGPIVYKADDADVSEAAAEAVSEAPTETPEPTFNLTGQIEEQEIYNQNGVVIRALSLDTMEYTDSDGQTETDLILNIYAENTGTTAVTPKLYCVSVNGVAVMEFASNSWLDPGTAGNNYYVLGLIDDPTGYYTPLVDLGITDVAEISFELVLTDPDSDSWYNVVDTRYVTLETDISGAYAQAALTAEGDVLYDENGIRIVCLGLAENNPYPDDNWSGVRLYVENNSEEFLDIEMSEFVTLNGCTVDFYGPTWFSPVTYFGPGTCAYTNVWFSGGIAEDYGVDLSEALTEMTCTFQINRMDYVFNETNLYTTPEVTVSFE